MMVSKKERIESPAKNFCNFYHKKKYSHDENENKKLLYRFMKSENY